MGYADRGYELTQRMAEYIREWYGALFIESILPIINRRRRPTYSELDTKEDHTSDPERTAKLQVSMCFINKMRCSRIGVNLHDIPTGL